MPYAFNGRCYETTAEGLKAFQVSFPRVDGTATEALNSSSINATGLVTFSIAHRPLTTNTVTARTGTLQLTACTDSYVNQFEALAIQDIAVGIGIALAFAIGFAGGFKR